jgi:hypothetical protein
MEVNTKLKRLREQLTGAPPVEVPKSASAFSRLIDWQADSWQLDLLNAALAKDKPYIKIAALCARQTGKSSVCGVLACAFAMMNPGSQVCVVSPTLRQSSLIFKKVLATWKRTNKLIPGRETALSLRLQNGSSIIALPGGNPAGLRGHTADLLIFDEANFTSRELYGACLAFQAAVASPVLVMISTPGPSFGDFFDEWQHGVGYTRFKITGDMCPRISKEFLLSQKQRLPEAVYRAEYECEFSDREYSVFSREMIDRCVDPELETLDDILDAAIGDVPPTHTPLPRELESDDSDDGISIDELGFEFEDD